MCYKSRYFLKNLYKLYEMDFIGFGFIGTGTKPVFITAIQFFFNFAPA